MQVFRTIYERLLRTGVVAASQIRVPPELVSRDTLVRAPTDVFRGSCARADQLLLSVLPPQALAHCPAYVDAFCSGALPLEAMRRIGFPWSPELVERTLAEVSGTLLTAELALQHGLACNTAGGTHHAHRAEGSGYCILNDLAVTTASLLHRGLAERVMVVDLDVHQGDGTATMLADEPRAYTLSMHCGANFPARKAASTQDVALPPGTGDDEFLDALAAVLPAALASFRPSIVLFDAGVDPHAADGLGRLALSDAGLLRRELFVLHAALDAGVPVAGYVGGGYADDLEVLAARHCLLHEAAAQAWREHKL
jgi:acetoin utilization deacetylase AcuC-like enzyme